MSKNNVNEEKNEAMENQIETPAQDKADDQVPETPKKENGFKKFFKNNWKTAVAFAAGVVAKTVLDSMFCRTPMADTSQAGQAIDTVKEVLEDKVQA